MGERTDTIERRIVVPGLIEAVWQAITDPVELAQWFGDSAEVELREGGAARFGWSDYGETVHAVVVEVEPPHRFAFRWSAVADTPVEDGPSTLVEFTLTQDEDGTSVRVIESGFADLPDRIYEQTLSGNSSGWDAELEDLAGYLRVGV